MVWATRTVSPPFATEASRIDGLAYSLWLPRAPEAGIVVLHGAGSDKESHHDFARAALAFGLATICFDARGHGESDGPLGARAVDDVVTVATLLRDRLGDERAPLALRGSSMGGYLAIVSAAAAQARAVVAICPASAAGLRRGLAGGRFSFAADHEALDVWLAEHELEPVVAALQAPLLLLHAEGDEQVPIEHSRALVEIVQSPGSLLIAVPGGHHRSIQHDPELQVVSLRFIEHAIGRRARTEAP